MSQKTDYKIYWKIAVKLASLLCVNGCLLPGRLGVALFPLALFPFCASLLLVPSGGILEFANIQNKNKKLSGHY